MPKKSKKGEIHRDQKLLTPLEKQIASFYILRQKPFNPPIFVLHVLSLLAMILYAHLELSKKMKRIYHAKSIKEGHDILSDTNRPPLQKFLVDFLESSALFFLTYCTINIFYFLYQNHSLKQKIQKSRTDSDIKKLLEKQQPINNDAPLWSMCESFIYSFWPMALPSLIKLFIWNKGDTVRAFLFAYVNNNSIVSKEFNRCMNAKLAVPIDCASAAAQQLAAIQSIAYTDLLLKLIIRCLLLPKGPIIISGIIYLNLKFFTQIYTDYLSEPESRPAQQSLIKHKHVTRAVLDKIGLSEKSSSSEIIHYHDLYAIHLMVPNKSFDKATLSAIVSFLKLNEYKVIADDSTQFMYIPSNKYHLPTQSELDSFIRDWSTALNLTKKLTTTLTALFGDQCPTVNVKPNKQHLPTFIIHVQTSAANYLHEHLATDNIAVSVYQDRLTLTGAPADIQRFLVNDEPIQQLIDEHTKLQEQAARAEQAGWLTRLSHAFFTTEKPTKASTSATAAPRPADLDDEASAEAAVDPTQDEAPAIPADFRQWSAQHNRPVHPSYNSQGIQTLLFFATALHPQGEEQEAIARKLEDPKSYVRIPAGSTSKSGIKKRPGQTRYSFKTGGHNAVFNAVTDDQPVAITEAGEALWEFKEFVKVH